MKKLLEQIRLNPERYGDELWVCRRAGDVLELSVKPDHIKEPENYRNGVIHIGRMIQAAEEYAEKSSRLADIHTFPSFEQSDLVAMIRFRKKIADQPSDNGLAQADSSKVTMATLLKSIASHQGFFLHPHNGNNTNRLDELMKAVLPDGAKGGRYYSLCTTLDNPFVWLRTGRWIEKVVQIIEENPSIPPPPFTYQINRDSRTTLNTEFSDCPYVQVITCLKPEKVLVNFSAK